MLVGLAIAISLLAFADARAMTGRGLQQAQPSPQSPPGIVVHVTQGESPFDLSVFNVQNNDQCVFQGFPGSRGDSVVPGPITFIIPPSIVAIRTNIQTTNSAVVVYNNTRDVVLANATSTGLTQADYYKDSTPTSYGQVNGGLIDNYDPNDPAHDASSPPSCYMTINFQTAAAPAPAPARILPFYPFVVPPSASG